MASDTTDSSFWRSYRRRIGRLRNPEAVSRSREVLSRFRVTRARLGNKTVAPAVDAANLPFSLTNPGAFDGGPSWNEVLGDLAGAPIAGGPESRYQLKDEELGRGGMGRVVVAYDSALQREVALKTPLPEVASEPRIMNAFMAESRLTAKLAHPNIVPIYDLVKTIDGQVGYVMRRVEGERLSDVLKALRRGEPARIESYGRVRLLTIFNQIVAAVAYAHDSRVIHRDLKPNNIMIGKYGEVLLLDWGLACSLSPNGARPNAGLHSSSGFVGAPAYISPEQLSGDDSRVDERSDIYSLGAILYEILTYTPPFVQSPEEDDEAFLARLDSEPVPPPSSRSPERNIPPMLEEICMRCLARDPAERYQKAMDVHRQVTMFLEGTREQEWRRKAAEARTQEALQAVARYDALCAETERCQREAQSARTLVNPWDPIERKRECWNLQQLAAQAEESAMVAFSEAEKAFHQALGHDSRYRPALEGLTDLYWRRFVQAEASRDLSEMRYFEARVRTFDEGRYAIRLKGDGRLILETDPPGAEVTLYTYREVDRVLRPVNPRELGHSPVRCPLPVGNYLLRIRHRGCRDVRYPILVSRLETIEARVRLYTDEELGADFVYIPSGPFRMGGDPEAFSPSMEVRWLEDYAIGRLPITSGQYLEFLNDILTVDPEEARRRAPRESEKPTPLWNTGPDGRYYIPQGADQDGHRWLPELPILYINWDDAVAYAAWRGAREGRPYRLPTADEWEKAARGVDGRVFPWGDKFDSTFCKNRESRPGKPYPEPVGTYPLDVSPYGVQDTAGGASDWTLDTFGSNKEMRLAMGGNWAMHERACRLARRLSYRQEATNVSIGFRLCFSLSRRW